MRAVRFHGNRDIRLDEIEEPVCGEGQVKIRPAFVGICGSDLHEYLHGPLSAPTTPHPITGETLPVTLGHEFSGTVEEVGAGVTRLRVGDRVAVRPNLYDGTCPACRMGRFNCCRSLGFIGYSGTAGGLSDHVVMKESHAIRLPDTFPLDVGALVEPLTVAWHAINQSSLKDGDTALVVGGGPIGLAIVQLLRIRGAANIVVTEVSPERQRFARQFGATAVLDPTAVDVVAQVREMTSDAGADVAFECAGVQAGLDAAVAGVRVGGTVVLVALWGEERPRIDAFGIVSQEKRVVGTAICEAGDMEAVIEVIASGKLDPRPMITSTIRMDEVEEKGFKALVNERDEGVQILVDIAAV